MGRGHPVELLLADQATNRLICVKRKISFADLVLQWRPSSRRCRNRRTLPRRNRNGHDDRGRLAAFDL